MTGFEQYTTHTMVEKILSLRNPGTQLMSVVLCFALFSVAADGLDFGWLAAHGPAGSAPVRPQNAWMPPAALAPAAPPAYPLHTSADLFHFQVPQGVRVRESDISTTHNTVLTKSTVQHSFVLI